VLIDLDRAQGALDAVFVLIDPRAEKSLSFARKIAHKIAIHSTVPILLLLNKA
jgi:hypothetical protein